MNHVSRKQYDQIKNKHYGVIFFQDKSSERDLFMGYGFGLMRVLETIQRKDMIPVFVTRTQAKMVEEIEMGGRKYLWNRRITYGELKKIQRDFPDKENEVIVK